MLKGASLFICLALVDAASVAIPAGQRAEDSSLSQLSQNASSVPHEAHCSANEQCVGLGLTGQCCPMPAGNMLDCCDRSVKKKAKKLKWTDKCNTFADHKACKTNAHRCNWIESSEQCTTCTDSPNWKSNRGTTCQHYQDLSYCTADGGFGKGWSYKPLTFLDYKSADGLTAAEACCSCGGSVEKASEKLAVLKTAKHEKTVKPACFTLVGPKHGGACDKDEYEEGKDYKFAPRPKGKNAWEGKEDDCAHVCSTDTGCTGFEMDDSHTYCLLWMNGECTINNFFKSFSPKRLGTTYQMCGQKVSCSEEEHDCGPEGSVDAHGTWDGQCIDKWWTCDDKKDCKNGSDEDAKTTCPHGAINIGELGLHRVRGRAKKAEKAELRVEDAPEAALHKESRKEQASLQAKQLMANRVRAQEIRARQRTTPVAQMKAEAPPADEEEESQEEQQPVPDRVGVAVDPRDTLELQREDRKERAAGLYAKAWAKHNEGGAEEKRERIKRLGHDELGRPAQRAAEPQTVSIHPM